GPRRAGLIRRRTTARRRRGAVSALVDGAEVYLAVGAAFDLGRAAMHTELQARSGYGRIIRKNHRGAVAFVGKDLSARGGGEPRPAGPAAGAAREPEIRREGEPEGDQDGGGATLRPPRLAGAARALAQRQGRATPRRGPEMRHVLRQAVVRNRHHRIAL